MFSANQDELTEMAKAVLFQEYDRSRFLDAQIPLPDMCISEFAFHPIARKKHKVPKFLGEKENQIKSGCYEFYMTQKSTGREISLYVGKAYDLRVRLKQHISLDFGSNWKSDYLDDMLDNSMMTNDGECLGFDDMGACGINLWEVQKDRERMFFEHLLIGKLFPIYNKA